MRRLNLKSISIIAGTAAFAATFFGLMIANQPKSEAVKATDFLAGRIIDDEVFYNPNTMTVEQIQAHLDKYSPSCDFWGEGAVGGGRYINGRAVPSNTSRREYARMMREAGNSKYHDAPYVCVNRYYENPETHETLYETNGEIRPGMVSAAQIIYEAAHKYNINPQVLLVLLKKESYVWGDNWPLKWEYNTVMGYACPDGAPCDSKYFGFYNQTMMAAWQLNYYRSHIYSYNYRPYSNNAILYSPDWSCGRKNVYLENVATTSLYIYTPYTPNDAALANYPGTSYCGSYGNRNFFMYFAEWFGSPVIREIHWEPSVTPRYMTTSRDTLIYDLSNNSTTPIGAGVTQYYSSKGVKDGKLCLRTKDDTDANAQRCVLYEDLEETNWGWMSAAKPRYIMATPGTKIIDLRTRNVVGDAPKVGYYTQKVYTPEGENCVRLEGEAENRCVTLNSLTEFGAEKITSAYPRYMKDRNNSSYFIDPATGKRGAKFSGTYYFNEKIYTPIGMFVCRENNGGCVNYDDTMETMADLNTPREMVVVRDTQKRDFVNLTAGESVAKGERLYVTKKAYYRGSDGSYPCLVVESDRASGRNLCVKREDLGEVLTDLGGRTRLTFAKNAYKHFYDTGEINYGNPLYGGEWRWFVKKTNIANGVGDVVGRCLLTEWDVANDSHSCTEESLLNISQ